MYCVYFGLIFCILGNGLIVHAQNGYCNHASENCGAPCNTDDDCLGGACWADQDDCDLTGYCNADSSNCGARCIIRDDCPGGDCFEDPESCGSPDLDHIVGTYMGAIPGGIRAPPISSITPTVNLIMLSFATDPQDDGHFQAFSEWTSQGITKENIEIDKELKPFRRYLVSLGGAVGYGGTFEIQPEVSVETWISNSVDSVSAIIESLSADGAEMQFEGGTGDANFQPAMIGLLSGLKNKGYLTAIGPYYGGTWNDYAQLPLDNVDYVNLQLYATETNTVDGIVNNIQSAVSDIGNDWSKMIAGFNTANRSPDPNVALMAVYELRANLKGTFSWDIEHSVSCNPAFCLEDNSANILDQGQQPESCGWPSSRRSRSEL